MADEKPLEGGEEASSDLSAAAPLRADEVTQFVKRFYAAWNAHDVEAAMQCCTEDVVVDDPIMMGGLARGRIEFGEWLENLVAAIPDLYFETVGTPCLALEGPTFVQQWRGSGTFSHTLHPWPPGSAPTVYPTGVRFEFEGADVHELRDGKLCYWNLYYDMFLLLRRVGLLPDPAGPALRVAGWAERVAAPALRWRTGRQPGTVATNPDTGGGGTRPRT
jgi:ketosteroid isomerase-like protein